MWLRGAALAAFSLQAQVQSQQCSQQPSAAGGWGLVMCGLFAISSCSLTRAKSRLELQPQVWLMLEDMLDQTFDFLTPFFLAVVFEGSKLYCTEAHTNCALTWALALYIRRTNWKSLPFSVFCSLFFKLKFFFLQKWQRTSWVKVPVQHSSNLIREIFYLSRQMSYCSFYIFHCTKYSEMLECH